MENKNLCNWVDFLHEQWIKHAIKLSDETKTIYKQRAERIKEIVKEHFKRKEFTKGYEIKQIQQKPTVSREEIIEAVKATWNSNWHDSRTVEGEVELMTKRLKALDLGVVEVVDD